MNNSKRKLLQLMFSTSIMMPYVSWGISSKHEVEAYKYINKSEIANKVKSKLSLEELRDIHPETAYDYHVVISKDTLSANNRIFIYDPTDKKSQDDGENVVVSQGKHRWIEKDIQFSLEDFGAIGDGVTDDTDKISVALNSGIKISELNERKYLLLNEVIIKDVFLCFTGCGIGKTTFLLSHYKNGIQFSRPISTIKKSAVSLTGFSIKRLNNSIYDGMSGSKGLYISNSSPLKISYIEECYGIGYGIHIDYSHDITVESCYVHDHKGKSNGLIGTDGIHFYRSTNILAQNNFIHDVGDDAISLGSFDEKYIVEDVRVLNNKIQSTKSGIKLYSFVRNVLIDGNSIIASREGGIYLTDDKNSPNNALISNVKITSNSFLYVGVNGLSDEAGALRIRFWPKEDRRTKIEAVTFEKNLIMNCRLGVSVLTYDVSKRLSNLTIFKNTFEVNENKMGKVQRYFISIAVCDGKLIINNNNFITPFNEIVIISKKNAAIGDGFQKTNFHFESNKITIQGDNSSMNPDNIIDNINLIKEKTIFNNIF